MQTFLESETSGRAGWGESVGSRKGGGEGCLRELTFLSTVYLKQALNNLLSVTPSKLTWWRFIFVTKYKDISHFEKSKTLSYDFTRWIKSEIDDIYV